MGAKRRLGLCMVLRLLKSAGRLESRLQAGLPAPHSVLVVLLSVAMVLAAPPVPLATFHGTVHGVSNKLVTIETAEGNLVDFEINRKTRVLRDKKQIRATDLATGDAVTIDAKQEMVRFLVAVTITVQTK